MQYLLLLWFPWWFYVVINFYQNRPKIKLFLRKKYKIFERRGLHPQIPGTAYTFEISGYASKSNHVFTPLISMPPEFSLMTRLESINFYQN